ncbi:MAG: DNA polymerase III subunit gamma/tau [Proteobacteria bacterium]|nr:DNA polymerase III subunit gamma/tau [Verrucomicrobiota bacterium]NBU08495.1 DNA polymerase III subunit gamma/tau [Pseudomonadota bacterium]
MSYQVIARKYRPQRFADVVGQEHVSQTLANAIASGRIAHAYLFCGPRGTGKTTLARIFAKALNCTGGPTADFDVADSRCVEIAEGRSLDVLEIDGASNNGVEQVRELRETCKFAPATSKFKIYIIDEVHMLSTAAFNALLKTLEEPPAHVKFMFATTDPEKVLPTILSRCQRFDLRRIPAALIVSHLTSIAKQEGVKIDDAALHAIARGADGGMRDAESTLDQLISFCGNEIAEADVLSMFGLTARAQLLALTRAVLAGEVDTALRELNDLAKSGKDLGRLVTDLLNHFRNLLIFQVSKGDLKLLEVSEAEATALAEQVKLAPSDAVSRVMEVLSDCESRLRDTTSKKILIEVSLLKAIQARNAVPMDAVLKQLQQLRAEAANAGSALATVPAAVVPEARPRLAPAPAAVPSVPLDLSGYERRPAAASVAALAETPAPAPKSGGSAELDALWAQLLEAVGRVSQFTRGYLLEAHPVSFNGKLFTIGFDPEFADHMVLVDNSKTHTVLQTKLAEFGHAHCQVKFIKADAAVRTGSSQPAAETSAPAKAEPAAVAALKPIPGAAKPEKPQPFVFDKENFKNDPLIKKALEVFKGTIVEARS